MLGQLQGILKEKILLKSFELPGLEHEAEWLEAPRLLYREILCWEWEHAASSYISGYQVVLLADVLEHITKPEKESLSLISLQLNCSTFIISVPNIANTWMRLSSLFGKFDYISRGILERTHVRFFTRATFLAFVEQNRLRIYEFHATPIPLSLVNPFFVNT